MGRRRVDVEGLRVDDARGYAARGRYVRTLLDEKIGDARGLPVGRGRDLCLVLGLHLVQPLDAIGLLVVVDDGVLGRTKKAQVAGIGPVGWSGRAAGGRPSGPPGLYIQDFASHAV